MKKIFSVLLCVFLFQAAAFTQSQITPPTDSASLRALIDNWIVANGSKQITANRLNIILHGIVNLMKTYAIDSAYKSDDTLILTRRGGFPPVKVTFTPGVGGSETDPTVPSALKSLTLEDITNWNGKQDELQNSSTIEIIANVPNAKSNEALWNASKLLGRPLASTAPSEGQALVWRNGKWQPANVSSSDSSSTSLTFPLDSLIVDGKITLTDTFSLEQLGDHDVVTKQNLENRMSSISGDQWGNQRIVSDSTLLGGGTEATDDSLRVNLNIVAGKAYVDSSLNAMNIAGGADGSLIAGTDTIAHDRLILGKGINPSKLSIDTTGSDGIGIATKHDIAHLTGLIGSGGIEVNYSGTLTTSNIAVPSELTVRNAIDAAMAQSGVMLTGWTNFVAAGADPNGGYSSGTGVADVFDAWKNSAPANSVLYIPRGTYWADRPLTLPEGKRLLIWQEGNIVSRNGDAYIIDGIENHIWIHGNILGTNQDITTPTYNSQTNHGMWLRNGGYNTVKISGEISGFKYAIRFGGYATGTSPVKGQQYTTLHFSYLRRNSVGILFAPGGGTSDSRGNWCNQNYVTGGRIAGDTGVVFRRDVNQGDQFNGNYLTTIGFEAAYTGANMKVGVYGEFGRNNVQNGWRFEKCDDPIWFTDNWDNYQMNGGIISVSELHHPGNNISINGEIYEPVNGITVGMRAQGYIYNSSNTFYNGRVRVWGTKYSPSVASALPANIDPIWEVETDFLVTASTYTVTKGLKLIKVNHTAGTAQITLPPAADNPNRIITVKNLHNTNQVNIVGAAANQTAILLGNMAAWYESDGTQWLCVSQTPPGGTGSGLFNTDAAQGGTTTYKLGIRTPSVEGAALAFPSSTEDVASYVLPDGEIPLTPIDGAHARVGSRIHYWSNSEQYTYLTEPDNGQAKQFYRRNAANNGGEYVHSPYELKFQYSSGEINVQNTTAATSIMGTGKGAIGAPQPGPEGTKVVYTASGLVSTLSGTQTFTAQFNAGSGLFSITKTLPGGLSAASYEMKFTLWETGTAYRWRFEMRIDNNGTGLIVADGNFSSTGFTGFSSNLNAVWTWATASSSNRLRVYSGEWEVFRNQ